MSVIKYTVLPCLIFVFIVSTACNPDHSGNINNSDDMNKSIENVKRTDYLKTGE